MFNLSELNASNPLRGLSTGPLAHLDPALRILELHTVTINQNTGSSRDRWIQDEMFYLVRPGDPGQTPQNEHECNRVIEVAKWAL